LFFFFWFFFPRTPQKKRPQKERCYRSAEGEQERSLKR
jgi:hypothetical protein